MHNRVKGELFGNCPHPSIKVRGLVLMVSLGLFASDIHNLSPIKSILLIYGANGCSQKSLKFHKQKRETNNRE